MQRGASIGEAMGMPREGHATPDKKAPGLGRNLKLESQRTWRTPMVPVLERGRQGYGRYAEIGSFKDTRNG